MTFNSMSFSCNLDAFWAPRAPNGAPGWLPWTFLHDLNLIRGQFWQFVCNGDKTDQRNTLQEYVRETRGKRNERRLLPWQSKLARVCANATMKSKRGGGVVRSPLDEKAYAGFPNGGAIRPIIEALKGFSTAEVLGILFQIVFAIW